MKNDNIKTHYIVQLIEEYGAGTTLLEVLKIRHKGKIYQCPKCKGCGTFNVVDEASSYFGITWVGETTKECDLCDGEGYTEHQYKPRMVQDGWEIVR